MPEHTDDMNDRVLAGLAAESRLRADFEAMWDRKGWRKSLLTCDDQGQYSELLEPIFKVYCEGRAHSATVDPCLAKRLPGEPIFVLLGRDRATPVAIRHWCNEREWHIANGYIQDTPEERAHIAEARKIMAAAIAWEEANLGASRSYRKRAA